MNIDRGDMPLPSFVLLRRRAFGGATSAVVVLVMLFGCSLASSSARASGLAWSAPTLIDQQAEPDLTGVACATTSLCLATDSSGHVLVSTDPASGVWTAEHVDGGTFMSAVACSSSGFCMAGDNEGNIVTSTNPAGGAAAWSAPVNVTAYVGSISCPAITFCAAVSYSGDVLTSTDPTGGPSAWHTTTVDSGNRLSSVSCPSAALCVLVDQSGNVLASTDPAGGAGAWSAPAPIAAPNNPGEPPEPLNAVSCPTTNFCAAVDGFNYTATVEPSRGDVITTTNPTGGAAAWSAPVEIAQGLFGVTCPTSSFCLAGDFSGSVYAAASPAGGAAAWPATLIDSTASLTGVACPSAVLCLAVDLQGRVSLGTATEVHEEAPGGGGEVAKESQSGTGAGTGLPSSGPAVVGAGPPLLPIGISSAQVAALLKQQLVPRGKMAKIGALLRHGGLAQSVRVLEAGVLSVGWYVVPVGVTLARQTKAKAVLVASGRVVCSGAGASKVKLKLTAAGRRFLQDARRVELMAKGAFTSSDQTVSLTRRFVLGR